MYGEMPAFINNQLTLHSSKEVPEKQTENKSITKRSSMCFTESCWVKHLQLLPKQSVTVVRIQRGKPAILKLRNFRLRLEMAPGIDFLEAFAHVGGNPWVSMRLHCLAFAGATQLCFLVPSGSLKVSLVCESVHQRAGITLTCTTGNQNGEQIWHTAVQQ